MTLLCGCPERFPEWDDQDIDLGGTLVHRLPIPMLMHMPLAYGFYVGRQQQMINQLGLAEHRPGLLLTRTDKNHNNNTQQLEHARSPARNLHVLPRPYWVYAVLHHGNLSTGHKVIQQMQARIVAAGRRRRRAAAAGGGARRARRPAGGGGGGRGGGPRPPARAGGGGRAAAGQR